MGHYCKLLFDNHVLDEIDLINIEYVRLLNILILKFESYILDIFLGHKKFGSDICFGQILFWSYMICLC